MFGGILMVRLFKSPFGMLVVLLVVAATSAARAQHGLVLNGVGPVNRSMGGAATACPIDSMGALHWNPGSICGLESSEMAFGMEVLWPTTRISSQVDLGPIVLAGSDNGDAGVVPIPSVGLVHKCCDSRWTLGLGMYGVAGFKANYPPSATNPILTPQPVDGGLGLGRISADADVMQIVPTAAYALTDRLSLGIAPTVSLAQYSFNPLVFAPPGLDGAYTSGQGTRRVWGGGVQAGIYYITDRNLHLGVSVKSPNWFEKVPYQTEDGAGGSRMVTLDIDYPLILSMGAAYSGWRSVLVAVDVRYIDYENTDGYDATGFGPDLALRGTGFRSVWATTLGVQYRPTDRLYLRMGYTYNQNPITSETAYFNAGCPLIVEHTLSLGGSYHFRQNLIFSVVWVHAFENSVSGSYQTPAGPLPFTSMTSTVSADALGAGFTLRY
jgi:long-chain fatty acid transport protein